MCRQAINNLEKKLSLCSGLSGTRQLFNVALINGLSHKVYLMLFCSNLSSGSDQDPAADPRRGGGC